MLVLKCAWDKYYVLCCCYFAIRTIRVTKFVRFYEICTIGQAMCGVDVVRKVESWHPLAIMLLMPIAKLKHRV